MTRDRRRLSLREYSHASGLAASIALKTSQRKGPLVDERAEVLVGKPKLVWPGFSAKPKE
jgi:hypothetical protein